MKKNTQKQYLNRLKYVLIISIFLLFNNALVFNAVGNSNQNIDVMLVIDSSTSMNQSDKDKIANEAMKLFVDMASVSGDRIGVIAYTDQIEREKALLQMDTVEDKNDLKAFIDDINRGAFTDIAVGVTEAVKVLEKSRQDDHFPMIVLLADGNNYLPDNRSQADSDKELQAAVDKAKQAEIPIYTIGLNADGKLNKEVLQNLADETSAKAFVTSSADDLPSILSEIFANHLKLKVIPLTSIVGNDQFQTVTVNIPNGNVIEANISMISNHPVEIKLTNPSGQDVSIPSDEVVYSNSNAYTLAKLINPEQGDWSLHVKGVKEDNIDINLIFNYDIVLEASIEPNQANYSKGDSIDISAQMTSNGQSIDDADLYKGLTGTLFVTDTTNQAVEEISLSNNGDSFTGSYTIADSKEYELIVKVEGASFYRETAVMTLNAAEASASASPTPAPTNAAPAETPKETNIPWTTIIIAAVALLVLVILAIIISRIVKERNRGFYGQLVLEILDLDTNERTTPQYKKLNAFKGKIKLHQLLQLAPEYIETEQIVFKPGKESIIIYNYSPCVIEKSGRAFDATKGKELRKNDRIKVTLQKVNKSISIEFII